MIAIALAALLVGLAGCVNLGRTPDAVQPFPLNTAYTERRADPGVVNLACYRHRGKQDDGALKRWDDSYCACTDFETKTVWISRNLHCPLSKVRAHEACHTRTGASAEARAECFRKFPV